MHHRKWARDEESRLHRGEGRARPTSGLSPLWTLLAQSGPSSCVGQAGSRLWPQEVDGHVLPSLFAPCFVPKKNMLAVTALVSRGPPQVNSELPLRGFSEYIFV